MSGQKVVRPGLQPTSAIPSKPQKKQKKRVGPPLPSSNTSLTRSQLRKEIKKDFNMNAKILDTKGRTQLVWSVPECSRHYLAARLDPFETIGGACMPSSQFSFPSLKTKVVAAGSLRLGTSGVGFIALLPAWANDSANIVTTTSTSVGTNSTALSAFTNLATFSFPQLPYASASFGADLAGRHLASGLRIQYTGALMNQNGMIYAYCDPDHSSVTATMNVNTFGNIETTRRIPVTGTQMGPGQWIAQVTDNGPVTPSETEFAEAPSVMATPYMVLAINGIAGDLYQWEAVEHIELQGRVVPSMTPSHVDPETYAIADNQIKEAFNHGPPQVKEEPGILKRIAGALSEGLPKLASLAGRGISSTLPAIIQGLTNLIPMTGSNPLIANQGFSYPMLMNSQMEATSLHKMRVSSGLGRGTNLRRSDEELFLLALSQKCKDNQIPPHLLVEALFALLNPPPAEPKRTSLEGKILHFPPYSS